MTPLLSPHPLWTTSISARLAGEKIVKMRCRYVGVTDQPMDVTCFIWPAVYVVLWLQRFLVVRNPWKSSALEFTQSAAAVDINQQTKNPQICWARPHWTNLEAISRKTYSRWCWPHISRCVFLLNMWSWRLDWALALHLLPELSVGLFSLLVMPKCLLLTFNCNMWRSK